MSITSVSAERFWEAKKQIPPIQISTNLNIVSVEKEREDLLEVPFVLTINYSPSVAQINLKGRAFVSGVKDEVERICKDYKEKKPPPPVIVQSISNVVFAESVLISKTLNIPPPIPLPRIPIKKPSGKKSQRLDYSA